MLRIMQFMDILWSVELFCCPSIIKYTHILQECFNMLNANDMIATL